MLQITKVWIILIILFIISSCNPCRYVSKHPECFPNDTSIVDTFTVVTENIEYIFDSTALNLYLQCDSNYNVLVKEYFSESSDKETDIKVVYKYKDNKLQIKSYADSIRILNTLVEKYKDTKQYIINPVNVQLKKDLIKSNEKLQKRKWLWWYFVISLVFIALTVLLLLTLKKLKK